MARLIAATAAWSAVLCPANAFVTHPPIVRLSSPVIHPPSSTRLTMSSHPSQGAQDAQALSRGDLLRRVAVNCVGGGWMLTAAAGGVLAKTPVMRLPDEDATTPARGYAGNPNAVVPPFKTLPDGLQIADIKVGDGEVAEPGKGVVVQWVLRRMNGYYVSASSEGDGEPFIYRVGDEKRAIKGFDEGIRGMKAGGTRRIVVPPKLAYVEGCKDGKPGPIPAGLGPKQQINTRNTEPLAFEVKVTKVR